MPFPTYETQGSVNSGELPEGIKLRRRMAQLLMERGIDTSPVGHWTQGAARAMNSWAGHLNANRLDARERSDNQAFGNLLASTLAGGGNPTVPTVPSTPAAPPTPTAPPSAPPAAPSQLATSPLNKIAMAMTPRPSPEISSDAGWGSNPLIPSGPHKAPVAPNDPFDFVRADPRYRDARQPGRPGAGTLDPGSINDVILHDFGSRRPGGPSPYHLAVRPDGTIVESYGPSDRAPHAFRFNNRGYGVSYDGPVGSQPTPAAMESLRFLAQGLQRHNPNFNFRSHGEAYRDTRGTALQASRDGRGLDEASWRSQLFPQGQAAPVAAAVPPDAAAAPEAAQPPVPLSERSMVAGHPNGPQEPLIPSMPGGLPGLPIPDRQQQLAMAAEGLNELPGVDRPLIAPAQQGQVIDQGQEFQNVQAPAGFDANSTVQPPGSQPAADPAAAPPGPGPRPATEPGMVGNDQIRALLQSGNPRAIALGVQLWSANQQAARQPVYDFVAAGDQLLRVNKRTGQAEIVPGVQRRGDEYSFHMQDGQAFSFNKRTGQARPVEGTGGQRPPEAIRTQAFKADQAYQNLTRELDAYAALIQRTGISVMPGADKDALIQARRNIQLQLKDLFGLGVLNGPDMQLMEEMLYDPSIGMTWTGPRGLGNLAGNTQQRATASINALKEKLRGIRNSAVAPVGMPAVEPAAPPATGNRPAARPPVGTRKTIGGRTYLRDDSSPSGWVEVN